MSLICIDDTPGARAARARRQSAERSRRYRRRLADEGAPVVRAVDAALAEALAFLCARDEVFLARDRERTLAATVSVTELLAVAGRALVRDGHERKAAIEAVARRVREREEHADPYAAVTYAPGPDYDRLRRAG